MKYEKAKLIAKNLPTGSYAAGCPSYNKGGDNCLIQNNPRGKGCSSCERAK